MNESNKPEVPKKHGWSNLSIIRKSQIIGAAIGVLITFATPILETLFPANAPFGHLDILAGIVYMPPMKILRTLDWKLSLYSGDHGWSITTFCFLVIINASLYLLVGTIIGWLLKFRNKC